MPLADEQRLPDDKLLLLHMADGNEQAFHQLFIRYRVPLFRFILNMTKSAVDAEDILQDVFVKIWERSRKMADLNEPRQYIYAIARNATFDFIKKVAKDGELTRQLWVNAQALTSPEVEELLAMKEQQEVVRSVLTRLSPARQEVFRMSREECLNLDQIAARMGLSRSRVKNLLVETLKQIRDALSAYSVMATILLMALHLQFLASHLCF